MKICINQLLYKNKNTIEYKNNEIFREKKRT